MTLDELRDLAQRLPPGSAVTLPREALIEAVAAVNATKPAPDADRWLTAKEVAERLHVSPRHVYAQRRGEYSSFCRDSGGVVRFSQRGLQRYMDRAQ